jgi:hypothetical protein
VKHSFFRCFLLLTAITFFASGLLLAQGVSKGLGFLDLPYVARNAAMGEAGVADDSDRLTALLNPALLHSNQNIAISISHQQWIQDVRSNFLQAAMPISFGTIGLTVASTTIGGIEVRSVPGPPIGTFDARSAVIAATIAVPLETDLTLGLSFQHIYEKIYIDEATGLLFDLGVLYCTPLDGFSAGASIQHLGSVGKLRDERSSLPTKFRTGFSYALGLENLTLRGVLAATWGTSETDVRIHGGAECLYEGVASLRLGYQTGYATRGFSVGFGVRYSVFAFDYGYVPFSFSLGGGHLLTISASL